MPPQCVSDQLIHKQQTIGYSRALLSPPSNHPPWYYTCLKCQNASSVPAYCTTPLYCHPVCPLGGCDKLNVQKIPYRTAVTPHLYHPPRETKCLEIVVRISHEGITVSSKVGRYRKTCPFHHQASLRRYHRTAENHPG